MEFSRLYYMGLKVTVLIKACIISSFADMHAFYFTRFHVLVFMTMRNL